MLSKKIYFIFPKLFPYFVMQKIAEFLEILYSPQKITNIKVDIHTDLWFILMWFNSKE